MKLWKQYTLAAALGAITGSLLPIVAGDTLRIFEDIAEIIVHFGRYLVFPLVFFATVPAIYEMLSSKILLRSSGAFLLYTLISSLLLTSFGLLVVLIFTPERVPIIIEESAIISPPSVYEQILQLFPQNFLSLFATDGNYLLPITLAAVLLALAFKRLKSAVLLNLFEDISIVFRKLNTYFLRILTLGIFFLAAYRIVQMRSIQEIFIFARFLVLIAGSVLFVFLVLIPAVLWLVKRRNPYPFLFANTALCLSALLSGDNYYCIPASVAILHTHLGHNEKQASFLSSLGAVFGRSGVAMISCMSFILILRSYSSLQISFGQYMWVIAVCLGVSFVLGASPSNSFLFSLVYISSWYSGDLADGYLILVSVLPILSALAVFTDSLVNQLNCHLALPVQSTKETD